MGLKKTSTKKEAVKIPVPTARRQIKVNRAEAIIRNIPAIKQTAIDGNNNFADVVIVRFDDFIRRPRSTHLKDDGKPANLRDGMRMIWDHCKENDLHPKLIYFEDEQTKARGFYLRINW